MSHYACGGRDEREEESFSQRDKNIITTVAKVAPTRVLRAGVFRRVRRVVGVWSNTWIDITCVVRGRLKTSPGRVGRVDAKHALGPGTAAGVRTKSYTKISYETYRK